FYWLIKKTGMFIEVDLKTKEIKKIFYDSTGTKFSATSSIIKRGDNSYWVGSVLTNYVTKLKLSV
ncbi:unnamed protein product, partial [marine sediment metagenome]